MKGWKIGCIISWVVIVVLVGLSMVFIVPERAEYVRNIDRIENLTWPDGTPVADDDEFDIAVNNYRATSQLLSPGIIFEEAICLLFWKPMSGETSAVSGT